MKDTDTVFPLDNLLSYGVYTLTHSLYSLIF